MDNYGYQRNNIEPRDIYLEMNPRENKINGEYEIPTRKWYQSPITTRTNEQHKNEEDNNRALTMMNPMNHNFTSGYEFPARKWYQCPEPVVPYRNNYIHEGIRTEREHLPPTEYNNPTTTKWYQIEENRERKKNRPPILNMENTKTTIPEYWSPTHKWYHPQTYNNYNRESPNNRPLPIIPEGFASPQSYDNISARGICDQYANGVTSHQTGRRESLFANTGGSNHIISHGLGYIIYIYIYTI